MAKEKTFPKDVTFPNPTVKQVIFQIRFPNLFYIENKIGDIQLELMSKFPEASLLVTKQFILAETKKVNESSENPQGVDENLKKIWQFKSKNEAITVNISSNSIDITSESHKTYNNSDSNYKFRDTIQFVIETFLKIMKIPIINRIGLRYIDECPLPKRDNETYMNYFNSIFNSNRISIDKTISINSALIFEVEDCYVRYSENFRIDNANYFVNLDFDGFAVNIKTEEYLAKCDKIHELIRKEFVNSIKTPVIDYMNRK